MLFSIALILLLSLVLSKIFTKLKIPSLVAMILTGILLGPFVLNQIDDSILNISAELRKIALIVILIRAGLSLDLKDLKRVGRPAVLLSFIPATLEIIAITFLGHFIFNMTYLEAAILGTVIAAVSPAVVVPRMIHLIDEKYGKENAIPQLILAGASVDDIFVIVLFTSFMDVYHGNSFSFFSLAKVPVSIVFGVVFGFIVGYLLTLFFKKFHMRDTVKVLIILSISFMLISVEHMLEGILPFSALLATMALGIAILKYYDRLAVRLKSKFSKIWVLAEIILFVLVGAAVDVSLLGSSSLKGLLLIFIAILFRLLGVFISLIKTKLTKKERLFTGLSYLPKATVQAAIGAIPLEQGVRNGNIVLVLAVLSILVFAPIGATLIDNTYKKLLDKRG